MQEELVKVCETLGVEPYRALAALDRDRNGAISEGRCPSDS